MQHPVWGLLRIYLLRGWVNSGVGYDTALKNSPACSWRMLISFRLAKDSVYPTLVDALFTQVTHDPCRATPKP